MGNGSSIDINKTIYVDINGRNEKIVFSRNCTSQDIVESLMQASGGVRSGAITLRDVDGALIAMSPSMSTNSTTRPYKLTWKEVKKPQDRASQNSQMLQSVLSQVSDHFNSAFKVEELQTQLNDRLRQLERKMENESLKLIEIEKCKKDIADIRDHIYATHRKATEFRMSPVSPMSDEKTIVRHTIKTVPSFQKYTLSADTISYLKQPTFDIWHWEANEMLCLLEHMYNELGLVREFNINPITLKRWLLCVQENYRNNPFHNFRHCFCVTQMMYGLLHMCKLLDKLPLEDVCVLITACICHDLDHPGYNNTYQINARTELAIRYNDISPLENHHCAVAFQILSNPETNIFANVEPPVFKKIRSGMVMLILATDMARHNEILEAFKSKHDNFDFSSNEHVNSLKMVMIKCCDISNEVRPFEVSEPWVDCLLEEYFNQSDREKEEGLPVAPFMDREKVTKPTAQIGFIKFVLIPMFDTIAKLFPQLYDVVVKPLTDARDRYEQMKEIDDKKKTELLNNKDSKEA